MRLRNFVFTINNPTNEDFKALENPIFSYVIYGKETGKQGTYHLQGYAELSNQSRFQKIKQLLPRAHIERRRGTQSQAIKYCKKDNDWTEFGEPRKQGNRSDLHTIHEMIQHGCRDIEICEEYPASYFRYYRSFAHVRQLYSRQNNATFVPVEVAVFWGEAGSGKTKRAHDENPGLYTVTDPTWWNGYDGQECILFDDFYGDINYSYFLRLLDGYKFQLPIKGGYTWKNWSKVVITSNKPPELWFPTGMTAALKRRISVCVEFPDASETPL